MYSLNPLSPHDALNFFMTVNRLNIPTTKSFFNKNFHETGLPIHGNFLYFLTHFKSLHPLQVENCESNSRLVVDEDDYGKFRTERVKIVKLRNYSKWRF